jgi:hypothetical protein
MAAAKPAGGYVIAAPKVQFNQVQARHADGSAYLMIIVDSSGNKVAAS